MTRATIEPTTSVISARTRRTMLAGAAALGLVLAGCGGGDDEPAEEETTTTPVVAPATTTIPTPTTTVPVETSTTVAEVEYVTDGAVVVVANASGINGAAGRLSERLAIVGYDMAEATNSADTVSNLATTQIYYDPTADGALAVAESIRQALGGGDIEVLEVAVPALTESGELGDATVLVLMGDDVADKTLDELQGRAPVDTTDDTTDDSTDDSGDDDSGDDDAGDDTGDEADDSTTSG